ncbi:hypothetical protein SUGI_0474030 [Cryptomeria japonica]|nr:hypothetical protein SUGI_0474030 [Cryptomeria japonica]
MSGEYIDYRRLEYLFALKEGLLELDEELKNQSPTNEDTVEMYSEIWSKMPQNLLMCVIAQLPTIFSVRFRAVSKEWKHLLSPAYTYQMSPSSVVQSSLPAFVISGVRLSSTRNLVREDLTLLQAVTSPRMYKLTLNFCPYELKCVVASCRSFLCCSGLIEGNRALFICNPVTRTFKTLPFITVDKFDFTLDIFDFCGFTFDASTRAFILVIGLNNCIEGERNNMQINLYDSESDR